MNEFADDSEVFVRRPGVELSWRWFVGGGLALAAIVLPVGMIYLIPWDDLGIYDDYGFYIWGPLLVGLVPLIAGVLVLPVGGLWRLLIVICVIGAIPVVLTLVSLIASLFWWGVI